MKIRIGTRNSRLARVQTDDVAAMLAAHGHEIEIVPITTEGDRKQDVAFDRVGTQGVFVKEIERALEENQVDLAVHSLKDLPGAMPEGLVLAAVPERLDAADRLLARPDAADPEAGVIPLVQGANVGTASARRECLLRALRPDLEVTLLRGNLPTRMARLKDGMYDAILLAAAGIERLDRAAAVGRCEPLPHEGIVASRLDPEVFVPAPAQGALALQTRRDDEATRAAAGALDDAAAHRAVRAERALLTLVEGGCQVPFSAWCRPSGDGDDLHMIAFLERNGKRTHADATASDPEALAGLVWDRLNAEGAA